MLQKVTQTTNKKHLTIFHRFSRQTRVKKKVNWEINNGFRLAAIFHQFLAAFFGSILLNKLPIAFHNEHRKWYRRFPFSFFPYGFSQILLYSVWKNCIPRYTNEFPATFEACVNRITIFQPVFPLKTIRVFVNVCLLFVFLSLPPFHHPHLFFSNAPLISHQFFRPLPADNFPKIVYSCFGTRPRIGLILER